MQIEITEETNSFRARPPMPMKQITGYRARGPRFNTPLVIQGLSLAHNYLTYRHIHKQP